MVAECCQQEESRTTLETPLGMPVGSYHDPLTKMGSHYGWFHSLARISDSESKSRELSTHHVHCSLLPGYGCDEISKLQRPYLPHCGDHTFEMRPETNAFSFMLLLPEYFVTQQEDRLRQ